MCSINEKTMELLNAQRGGEGGLLKLDVGAGLHGKEGFITLDKDSKNNPDILCNLDTEEIPLPNESVGEVWANYILEHVEDPVKVMEKIWRVCAHGAQVQVNVPHWAWDGYHQDPTHKHGFCLNSWTYWDYRIYESYASPTRAKFDLIHCEREIPQGLADSVKDKAHLEFMMQHSINIVQKIRFTLIALKDDYFDKEEKEDE